ncbi:MAG: DUF4340 domain-containing protein [Kiritimatiellia bacterium]
MNARKLILLIVAAVVLGGVAYLTSVRKEQSARSSGIGEPVLPALQDSENVAAIEKIRFVSSSGTVTVEKTQVGWVCAEKFGYSVDFAKVNSFVDRVRDMEIGQVLRADAGRMKDLGLVAPDATATNGGSFGTVVSFTDGKGNEIASMIVGEKRVGTADPATGRGGYPEGRYVAVGGRAYVISETLYSIPEEAGDWLDRELTNVSPSDIATIHVRDAGAKTFSLVRGEDDQLKLTDLAGDETMDSTSAAQLAGVLSYLRFRDLADPELDESETGLDTPVVYTGKTEDGRIYTVKLGDTVPDGSDRYAALGAEFRPPPDEGTEGGENNAEEGAEKDSGGEDADEAERRKKREALASEIAQFSKKTHGWVYVLPSYKVKPIISSRADLLKQPEEDKEETTGERHSEEGKAENTTGAEKTKKKKSFLGRLFGG